MRFSFGQISSILSEYKHVVLIPIAVVFLLFTAAVILEESVVGAAQPPTFGYRMF